MLVNLRKGTIQDELDQVANLLSNGEQLQGVTASAFCQARRKLDPLAVLALSERAVRDFYTRFAAKRWHGWRLLGVYGSTLRLPATADVIAEFGPPPCGSTIPLARLSRLYDVLNHLVVDADLVGISVGERVLAGEHLAALEDADDGLSARLRGELHEPLEELRHSTRESPTMTSRSRRLLATMRRGSV